MTRAMTSYRRLLRVLPAPRGRGTRSSSACWRFFATSAHRRQPGRGNADDHDRSALGRLAVRLRHHLLATPPASTLSFSTANTFHLTGRSGCAASPRRRRSSLRRFPTACPRTHSPAFVRVRVSPVVLLVLLAIELLLVDAAASASPRTRTIARMAVFVVPLAVTLGLRSYRALATLDLLDWDETYYTSIAVTGAAGRGLYPAVVGFGPMPAMGGIGYAAYAYALGVKLFGPSVLVLRAISLLVSVAGLAGVWVLSRKLYGTGTAWMAAALTSSLSLFVHVELRPHGQLDVRVRHLGARRGRLRDRPLGQQVAARARGACLRARTASAHRHHRHGARLRAVVRRDVCRADGQCTAGQCRPGPSGPAQASLENAPRETVSRATAAAAVPRGLAGRAGVVSSSINVLPDPSAYYLTTVLIRVDATHWYSAGTTSVVGSFLNPAILIPKAMALYSQLSGHRARARDRARGGRDRGPARPAHGR